MINQAICPSCGLQFEPSGSRPRCPSCGTRIAETGSQEEAPSKARGGAFFAAGSHTGFSTVGQVSLTGWVVGLLASMLFPIVLTIGIVAAVFGVVFDVQALQIAGAVAISIALVMFLFFLWKLVTGVRRAAGLWKGIKVQMAQPDDIEGAWRRTDDAP